MDDSGRRNVTGIQDNDRQAIAVMEWIVGGGKLLDKRCQMQPKKKVNRGGIFVVGVITDMVTGGTEIAT